jgi:hypothetical protein
MAGRSNSKEGKVGEADGGQARGFGRAFGFGLLGLLILAWFVASATGTAYAQGAGKALAFDGSGNLLAAEGNDAEMYPSVQAYMFPQPHLLRANDAETKEQKRERPPLSPARIPAEIVGGLSGGILGAAALAMPLGPYGGLTGLVLGSATSVYLVGNIGSQTGSFRATLLGTLAGGVGGIAVGLTVHAVRGDVDHDDLRELPILVGPAIGATIGFNRTRRYKTTVGSETGLINFGDGPMSLAVPGIYFRSNPFDGRRLIHSVDLVRVRF